MDGKMMNERYVAPKYRLEAFSCPYCGVYAAQKWHISQFLRQVDRRIRDVALSVCSHCDQTSLWIENLNSLVPFGPPGSPSMKDWSPPIEVPSEGKIVYPRNSLAPIPTEDMPEAIKADYLEAREIVADSPRSAAALLRLCIQKLMPLLGESGKDINNDIASLVKKGLPVAIQQAMDSVRVIGNESVHPGVLDLNDDRDTALALFDLLNIIVEKTITQQKKIDEIFNKLPQSKRDAIAKRDR
jgi:hypothetical protein